MSRRFLRVTSRAFSRTNLSHMMVPPRSRGREAGFLFRNGLCQDSPFLASRMHCPCAGEWLTTQCASVPFYVPMQVCLRVSELHFGVAPECEACACHVYPSHDFCWRCKMCGILTSTSGLRSGLVESFKCWNPTVQALLSTW